MSVIRNTGYNVIAALVPIAVSLLTVPLYVHAVGEERYGVMALIAMLLGYFGVFDFGLSTATAQRLAASPPGDLAARRRVFWTAASVNLALGLAGAALILPVAWAFADLWMKAPPALVPEVRAATVWLVMALPVMLLTGVLRGALQGAERFAEMNLVNVVVGTATQLIPLAVALWWSPSLTVVLPALYATRMLVLACYLAVIVWRVTLGWHFAFDRGEARRLLSFGGWMTLSSLIGPIITGLDRVLIGAIIGVRQVSHYTVPFQLAERAMFVPAALSQALFPRVSAIGDRAAALALSRRGLGALAACCAPPMVAGALFMHPFLVLWMGRVFADQASLVGQIVVAGFWFNALGMGSANHLMATGRPRLLALAHALEVVPYVALLAVCMNGLGAEGAALAFALRVAADDLLLGWLAGLLGLSVLLVLAGAVAFAVAIWLGAGLELDQTGRLLAALALLAAVSVASLAWLYAQRDSLLAALPRRQNQP